MHPRQTHTRAKRSPGVADIDLCVHYFNNTIMKCEARETFSCSRRESVSQSQNGVPKTCGVAGDSAYNIKERHRVRSGIFLGIEFFIEMCAIFLSPQITNSRLTAAQFSERCWWVGFAYYLVIWLLARNNCQSAWVHFDICLFLLRLLGVRVHAQRAPEKGTLLHTYII